ncbi:hypothetical protein H4R33_003798 [Dimargaris cristalligena]|nr:hypothetical protein H4R33_003798 [Dimargaris cristalligena]
MVTLNESISNSPYVWYTNSSIQLDNLTQPAHRSRHYNVLLTSSPDAATHGGDGPPGSPRLTFEPIEPAAAEPTSSTGEAWSGESRLSGIWAHEDLAPGAFISWRIVGQGRGLDLRLVHWQQPAPLGHSIAEAADIPLATVGPKPTDRSPATPMDTQLHLRFPSPLLPAPTFCVYPAHRSLVLWLGLASGFVVRLSFKAPYFFDASGLQLHQGQVHALSSVVQSKRAAVMIHGINHYQVVVGCHDGVAHLLDAGAGPFQETELNAAGLFSQVKTLLPMMAHRLFQGPGPTAAGGPSDFGYSVTPLTSEWQTISFATLDTSAYLPVPQSRLGHNYVLSLSRDRKLRVWSADRGQCVRTVALPFINTHGAVEEGPATREHQALLLSAIPRPYVQVVPAPLTRAYGSVRARTFYVVVYVPDEALPYFVVYRGEVAPADGSLAVLDYQTHRLCPHGPSERPAERYLGELADFRISAPDAVLHSPESPSAGPPGCMLWALWETGSDPHRRLALTYCPLSLASGLQPDERWARVLNPPHPDVVDPAAHLEARLVDLDQGHPAPRTTPPGYSDLVYARQLAEVFLEYLFYPGRFAWSTLTHALGRYQCAFRSTRKALVQPGTAEPLQARLFATVGVFLSLRPHDSDGTLDVAGYRRQLRTEWMRYLTLCSQLQTTLETPRGLVVLAAGRTAPAGLGGVVVSRGSCLSVVRIATPLELARLHLEAPAALGVDLLDPAFPSHRLKRLYPAFVDPHHRALLFRAQAVLATLVECVPSPAVDRLLTGVAHWVSEHPSDAVPDTMVTTWYQTYLAPELRGSSIQNVLKQVLASFFNTSTDWRTAWVAVLNLALDLGAGPSGGDATGDSTTGGADQRPGPCLDALLTAAFQQATATSFALLRTMLVATILLMGTEVVTRFRLEGFLVTDSTLGALLGRTNASDPEPLTRRQWCTLMTRLVYRQRVLYWLTSQPLGTTAASTALDRQAPVPSTSTGSAPSGLPLDPDQQTMQDECIAFQSARQSAPTPASSRRPGPFPADGASVDLLTSGLSGLNVMDRKVGAPLLPAHFLARQSSGARSVDLEYSLVYAIFRTYLPLHLPVTAPTMGSRRGPSDPRAGHSLTLGLAAFIRTAQCTMGYRLGLKAQPGQPGAGESGGSLPAAAVTLLTLFPEPWSQLAYRMQTTDQLDLAQRFLSLAPVTLATQYLWGHLYLRFSLYANAFRCLHATGVAGFDPPSPADPFYALLPAGVASRLRYYVMCADLMESYRQPAYATRFCRLALAILGDAGPATTEQAHRLYFRIFHSTLQCHDYEAAYQALLHIDSDPAMQKDCLRHLVSVLCETSLVHRLTQWTFGDLQDEVEQTLLFKARNSEVNMALIRAAPASSSPATPNYYKILYAYHVYRGDYRNAGSIMYQYAQRLGQVPHSEAKTHLVCLVEQATVFLSAIQALALVDHDHAWVLVPPVSHLAGDRQAKKRRVESFSLVLSAAPALALSPALPPATDPTGESKRTLDIVRLLDIQREYQLCLAKLKLAERFPFLQLTTEILTASAAVSLFARCGMYNDSLSLALQFELDLFSPLRHLAARCVEISQDQASGRLTPERLQTDDFWTTEAILAMECAPEARAWRLLQSYLDQHDPLAMPPQAVVTTNPVTGEPTCPQVPNAYRTAVADQILASAGNLPPWLTQPLLEYHPDTLLRLLLKHHRLEEACRLAIKHLQRALGHLKRVPINHAAMRWLPFSLLDQLRQAVRKRLTHPAPTDPSQSPKTTGKSPQALARLRLVDQQLVSVTQAYLKRVERETEECLAQV